MDKTTLMTTVPVERLIGRLAIPSIMNMMVSALYNMADTYFVSYLGTSAVAAVGITLPLQTVIQAIGFLFGQGSGNYIAWMLGARKKENALKMAAAGFFSAVLIVSILAVLGSFNVVPLAGMLGATDTILPYAKGYIGIILIGAPLMAGSLTLNSQLRFQGSPFYAVMGVIAGTVLNIFLDPLFIFVLGLGIRGAALATIISQGISCAILLYVCSLKDNVRIEIKYFLPLMVNFKEIFRGGIPAFLRQLLTSVGTITTNNLAGAYGDAAIAAISIGGRIFMFASSAMIGFGQGFQPVCGFNYGAKRYDRVKKAFWFCIRLSTIFLIIASAILAVFAPEIISRFRKDDAEVLRIGILSLRLHCISLPLTGWIVLAGFFTQNTNSPIQASLIATSRQGIFLIPFLFILTSFWGLLGVQLSPLVSDTAAFLFSIPLTIGVLRKLKS
jgi:putative MATE family efflux protein